MGKSKTYYRKLSIYDNYLARLIKDKESFELAATSFTKKIKVNDLIYIFNENGDQDPKLLQLINRVRNDAARFDLTVIPSGGLVNNWFDLTERPEETVIAKVDIKSAYWETALKMGVISDETNRYLQANFEGKGIKLARLKALGSLATRKVITQYENGVKMHVTEFTQPTRELYMYVCSTLDEIMQKAVYHLAGAFYYYWDCVFVSHEYHKDVMQFLKDFEYGSTVELTELSVINLGTRKYLITGTYDKLLVTPSDLKEYPIPQEKIWILNT
jgi:hypothetical protein